MKKFIILLPPPCTNADLHMGHLAGVYIPADIYSRYLKLNGYDVISLGGADQNNTYTQKKSIKTGETFQHTQAYYAKAIYKSISASEVNCSCYIETSSKSHIDTVNEILKILLKKDLLKRKKINQFYCNFCNEHVVDSFASGDCMNCHSQSDAGICENCNTPIFNLKLTNAIHTICSNSVILKSTNIMVMNIDNLKERLIKLIHNSEWNFRIKNKYLNYLNLASTEDITVSYGFKHGIDIDDPSLDVKAVPIWFEALWSMFTALKEYYSLNLEQVIEHLCDDNLYIIPFMGQDTEYYYAIGLSAVLLGLGINKIPNMLSIQRFVKLDGRKFSSSRNHIVTISELKEKYPVDFIRYYCFSILRPYSDDSNEFNLVEMNNFYLKCQDKIQKLCIHFDHWRNLEYEISVLPEAKSIFNNYRIYMLNLEFNKSILEINKLIKIIFTYIMKKPLTIEIAYLLNMLNPIMPNVSNDVWQCFFSNNFKVINSNEDLCNQPLKFIPLKYNNNLNKEGVYDVLWKKYIDKNFKELSDG